MGAEAVELAERLTSGLENCTDQGRVTLTRRAEWRLFYVWALPDDPLTVTGLLLRSDGGLDAPRRGGATGTGERVGG